MAHLQDAPFRAQDTKVVSDLVASLESHCGKGKGKGGFSVRKHDFRLPSGRVVHSWKMQDWDYKKPNLPTYARGLFTYKNLAGNYEIAVRGYDKFFNHGEVNKTQWRNVERNTRGPYELSVKENGCIIFISGLDDGTLLVCSKHSTGARDDTPLSHAQAGEQWVERHLATVGKTKEDLARTLRQMNATAVAELCDDTFEEHVLAYNPEQAGLYLHGININVPEFMTYPGHLVDKFATEWGMKKTMYVMEDDIHKVKGFLDGVAETGMYDGRETEGFVIRCQARDKDDAPWEDWFFKYKFEEPYLMYRQWRECTKALIAGKQPRIKKHKAITEEYLAFAKRQLAANPSLAKAYTQNHGIISLRDAFLKERGVKGSDIIRQEIEAGEGFVASSEVTKNVVLIPIATIGCGKTTVAVALAKLFGWGHVQNDNIEGRKNRPQRFAEACAAALATRSAMISDRNNHQRREREQIMRDMQQLVGPDVRFVALHWVHDRQNYDQIRKTMQDRVLSRGDNHQTIQANKKGSAEVIGIMEGFLQRFQPVKPDEPPDDLFDTVINLDVTASSRENLETIVAQLNSEYPKLFGNMPTAQDLDNAIEAAMNDYRPDIKHELNFSGKQKQQQKAQQQNGGTPSQPKPPKIDYFCIKLPSARVTGVLDAVFKDQDSQTQHFYRQLQGLRRVQPEFHVTLIHRASARDRQDHWDRMLKLHATRATETANPTDPDLGTAKVQLERLVWDSRVMCFVVRLLPPEGDSEGVGAWESANEVTHVTVGTASKDIKPKESNDLLKRWLLEGSGEQTGIREVLVRGQVILDGVVKGVLQRF
ncbi:tRNA ligase fungi [Macrophomina phaseolina MS6]|uniref:tRNA ligase n=1 Tax=Macrophomina phaseolina (strain MS6) TaxID=1126212 RepID=K2SAS6_MACPH|nr:tRNA ligase fungi [Macrophomina phaseolina MS6]